MDNNLPDQQIEEPQVINNQEPPNVSISESKKGLLYGIVFVIIILVFFLGILNYFNILLISNVFPNQLSWLPRQTVQKPTENISTNNPTRILLPPPPSSHQPPPPPPTHPLPTAIPTPK